MYVFKQLIPFVGVLLVCGKAPAAEPRTLFDFSTAATRGSWTNVNDGVMGGRSVGRYSFTDAGNLQFFGTLSLENNGGFASVRSRPMRLGLKNDDVLRIRVKGDGRKYFLDVRSPSNRMAFSYRVSIQTQASKWQEFEVPLANFVGTSFGRTLPKARPNASSVNSIGLTLSDKRPGPFQLEVAWIKTNRKEMPVLVQ